MTPTRQSDSEARRLLALVEQARDLIAEAYCDDEDDDSPGNMAFALLTSAITSSCPLVGHELYPLDGQSDTVNIVNVDGCRRCGQVFRAEHDRDAER